MSGAVARSGFRFQDLYLLLRVLNAARDGLHDAWNNEEENPKRLLDMAQVQFGVEASWVNDAELASTKITSWDVLIWTPHRLEFGEAKSGEVTKDDRRAFWLRLRQELAREKKEAYDVVPVLVLDPIQLSSPNKWRNLAQTAIQFAGEAPATEPKNKVIDANTLLKEALWYLCSYDVEAKDGAPLQKIQLTEALSALRAFELHEHQFEELEAQVLRYVEAVFPDGLTKSLQHLVMGWINERATAENLERRLFTLHDILGEFQILDKSLSLAPGILAHWKKLFRELHALFNSRSIKTIDISGQSVSSQEVQPHIINFLETNVNVAHGHLILGHGGSGKSALLSDICSDSSVHAERFCCAAQDLNSEELQSLQNVIRFRSALAALINTEAVILVAVDGLDEVQAEPRISLVQLLARLATLPNVQILATMRKGDWQSDGETRRQLTHWKALELREWPTELVRQAVSKMLPQYTPSDSTIGLLRTPFFLDLFWRTFLEGVSASELPQYRVETRHELLATFWEMRIVKSDRNKSSSDLLAGLDQIFARQAEVIGGFESTSLPETVVELLLSESVLIPQGRLRPRLVFRHPLLRDFALSQWCLGAKSSGEALLQWTSIKSALSKFGALRQMMEALFADGADAEYPGVAPVAFLHSVASHSVASASDLAYALGGQSATPSLNPLNWPKQVTSCLPLTFGSALLKAATFFQNFTWAAAMSTWPPTLSWLDQEYAITLVDYTSQLARLSKDNPEDLLVRTAAEIAARKLREFSEQALFLKFREDDQFYLMHAVREVLPLVPDHDSLQWIRRILTDSTWRTRMIILQRLKYLAATFPNESGELYVAAVGLEQNGFQWTLKDEHWMAGMDRDALEWSLIGEENKKGLLQHHPQAFLAITVRMVEALWHREDRRRIDIASGDGDDELLIQTPELNSEITKAAGSNAEIIDDRPEWNYWQRMTVNDSQWFRCCHALHVFLEEAGESDQAQFLDQFVPVLRSSRTATVHSFILDIAIKRSSSPEWLAVLRQALFDRQAFLVDGLTYWMEQALHLCWDILSPEEKAITRLNLNLVRTISPPRGEILYGYLLAAIPTQELTLDEKRIVQNHFQQGRSRREHPETFRMSVREVEWSSPFDESFYSKGCPSIIRTEQLLQIATFSSDLAEANDDKKSRLEVLKRYVPIAAELLPLLKNPDPYWTSENSLWLWNTFTDMLNASIELEADLVSIGVSFPTDLVIGCCDLALEVVENIPNVLVGELSTTDHWLPPQTPWTCAVRLLDAALVCPQTRDNAELQDRFERVLVECIQQDMPLLHLVILSHFRDWHWLRSDSRKELFRFFWEKPVEASILVWSFQKLRYYPDEDRATVLRSLSNRNDIINPLVLVKHIAKAIGQLSIIVYADGTRSKVKQLATEILDKPEAFSLIAPVEQQAEFFESFVFGLKEAAKEQSRHSEIASEYSSFVLYAWNKLHVLPLSNSKRRMGVVLYATHWLSRCPGDAITENSPTSAARVTWLAHLLPFLTTVATTGSRKDCHALLFGLHDGDFNDAIKASALLDIVNLFVIRLEREVSSGELSLDSTDPDSGDWNSFRDCARYAVLTVRSLYFGGWLIDDNLRESAHRLLTRFSSFPILLKEAHEAILEFRRS